MGCPKLTERDYFRLHNSTEKSAYSRFFHHGIFDYTNDALGRRTAIEKSGTAFSATDTINYSYNDRSEVTSADATNDTLYNFGFDYDLIGNRKTYDTTESGSNVQSVYSANNLNQYTSITNPSQSPTYDDDGNMLTMTLASGSWTNTFNAENRLVSMVKGTTTIEFKYDYKGRRVEKKVTEGGSVTKQERYVYDNYKKIETLDALNSNAVAKKNVWQGETLLAETHGANTYYALADANKNVTEYIDSTGAVQGHYEYSPFGKQTVKSGTMADDFDYRFSSEVFDGETNLSYFNFRYYLSELGRWLSRDPIEEGGGVNLYAMLANRVINLIDYLGLAFGDIYSDTITYSKDSQFTAIGEIDWGSIAVGQDSGWLDPTTFETRIQDMAKTAASYVALASGGAFLGLASCSTLNLCLSVGAAGAASDCRVQKRLIIETIKVKYWYGTITTTYSILSNSFRITYVKFDGLSEPKTGLLKITYKERIVWGILTCCEQEQVIVDNTSMLKSLNPKEFPQIDYSE